MSGLEPDALRARLESDRWASRLGIEAPSGDGGVFTMALHDHHLNFLDGCHGGALYSLAEAAFVAVASAHGADPVTLDSHLVLTAGSRKGDVLSASVTPVNTGRTLATYSVSVTRSDGRLVGSFTGTAHFGGGT